MCVWCVCVVCVLCIGILFVCFFFFFNDTATTEIYTLSLHDALPICDLPRREAGRAVSCTIPPYCLAAIITPTRSEEHTSELQSPCNLVCRLLLEKKKKRTATPYTRRCSQAATQVSSPFHPTLVRLAL